MNVLILINGAPQHRPFYSRVGDELVRRKHSVVYAVDSHYTDVMYPGEGLHQPTHYLSDYFRERRATATIPRELENERLWMAMFPDFDRFNCDALATSGAAWRDSPGYYRSLVAVMSSFFWELFEAHKFDCVVYEGVSNAFAYMAYLVAEKHGARYLGFAPSRMPKRITVSTTKYHSDGRLPQIYREIRERKRAVPPEAKAAVTDYLRRFLTTHPDDTVAFYQVPKNPLKRYSRTASLTRVARALRYQLTHRGDHEYAYQVPDMLRVYPLALAWEMERSARHRKLHRSYYKQQPPFDRPYFVYPMHFHPESSTSVNAPFYVDELTMVRNIAMSLPVNVSLYVKDHQHTMAARQPMSFYEQVARTPNVELIHPAVDAKSLVARSLGVVTVTGTMGYEAIVMGKPVFAFGHTFYDFHPLCTRIEGFESAFAAFSSASKKVANQEEIFDFVAAYYLSTYPGVFDLQVSWDSAALVDQVATIIEEHPVPMTVRQYEERALS
jgi:hypothetical protein